MTTLIEIKKLTKKYKETPVLDQVSLSIVSGEIIALLGENGAGKSTLINLINDLIGATSGEVKVNIAHSKIGVMLQDNITLNRLKVSETLQLARSYYQNPLPYAELLRLSDLTHQENLFLSKLSGGQKRRLTFALALAGDPDLIFLDEPTTGMDAERRAAFWQEITQMSSAGKTFFITSHYLEELENLASRIILLHTHKIAFDGTLADLRAQNAVSEISFNFDGNLTGLSAVVQHMQTGNFHRLTTNNSLQLIQSLVPFFEQGLSNLTVQQNSLDNLFQNLIKTEGTK